MQRENVPMVPALIFAAAPLILGMSIAALSFGLGPPVTYRVPLGWAPSWLFWAVWLVLYPTLGLSAWSVWQARKEHDVRGVLSLFAAYYVGGLFFLPIMVAVRGNPIALTLMDLQGVLGTAILAWAAARYSRRAVWFLVPIMVWMPITLALKAWLTVVNS